MATASVPPTMTTMPLVTFTPLIKSPTSTPPVVTPTPTNMSPATTPSATLTPTGSLPAGMACIPGNQRQYGKALEIIDGNTIKVLINGLVYQVRYIGVKLPDDMNTALLTAAKNGELVYLKDLTLIGDGADKDQVGRLLRYVMAEDQFINLELIQQGYAYADAAEPLSSCGQVFKDAEQAAQAAKSGIWKFIPATPAP
jgi:micrococcal nuclease